MSNAMNESSTGSVGEGEIEVRRGDAFYGLLAGAPSAIRRRSRFSDNRYEITLYVYEASRGKIT